MADPLEQAILLELLPAITKIRYAELASTMIILFDHLLTLDQEIRLIWHAQRSLGKILFLMNRYYALCIVVFNNYVLFNTNDLSDSLYVLFQLFRSTCVHWFRWQGVTGVITFIIAEFILQLRLYALYFRDKRILIFVTFVTIGAAISSSYVMGHALSLITAYAIKLPLSGSTVCVPLGLPSDFYAFWVPMLISESILCGLALLRGFKTYRPGQNVIQSGKRIIEILVRDSLSYFVIIFATYLANTIIFLTRPGAEVEIPVGFAVALSCVMSSRLCLNVRGYIRQEADPFPSASVVPPRLGPSGFISLGYGDEEDGDKGQSNSQVKSLIVRAGTALGDVEMHELRIMRADSPKHFRMLSLGNKDEVTEIS